MQLWRISAHAGLDGLGGRQVSGRWHGMPRAVLYAAEHPALAMVEVMAHMRLRLDNIPTTLKLITLDVADGAIISRTPALPDGWQANVPATQAVGNQWLDGGKGLLLPLPSALLAEATNYLLNPAHPQAASHLRETKVRPFWFDPRLLR